MNGVVSTKFFIVAVVVGCAVGSHDDGDAAIPRHERNPERTRLLRELRWGHVLCPGCVVVFDDGCTSNLANFLYGLLM